MWTTRREKIYIAIFLGLFFLFKGHNIFNTSSLMANSTVSVSNKSKNVQDIRDLNLNVPQNIKQRTGKEKSVLMHDVSIRKNWGLMGTSGKADISVLRAWEISKGSKDIIVAVIDTGIDTQHEDLKDNLWKNPGETGLDKHGKSKASNKKDDDGNGFVDDVYGWNFVSNNNDVKDYHGHGTHVAGIIGAKRSGVSPQVSLMTLKYYDSRFPNTNNLKNTVQAIKYATAMGAKIINYSGGGVQYSTDEFKAIKAARDKGVLFVAAAGNESSNSNKSNYYPAKYPLDNIISVTAINRAAQVLSSSNWGHRTVHIAAPGESIFSTLPQNRYGTMTGTSQATAFVSGVGSLIYAQNEEFNYLRVKEQILSTADEKKGLRSKTVTSGKLNAWAALAMQSAIPVTGVNDTTAGTNLLPQFVLSNTNQGLSSFKDIGEILKKAQ